MTTYKNLQEAELDPLFHIIMAGLLLLGTCEDMTADSARQYCLDLLNQARDTDISASLKNDVMLTIYEASVRGQVEWSTLHRAQQAETLQRFQSQNTNH